MPQIQFKSVATTNNLLELLQHFQRPDKPPIHSYNARVGLSEESTDVKASGH